MSDYKSILVHYDAGKTAPERLETAIEIAGTFGAHVACLYALSAVPGADIALYLTRHGVKVTVSRYDAPDMDVGNQLLSRAFDLSADLIVMGAWGHSRLREFILGGVTRTLLESMTVPVLMAH